MKRFFYSLLLIVLVGSTSIFGQRIKKSQKGTISQLVAQTEITITYFRPVARGRELFGDLVKFDEVWQPGANDATVFEIDKDIKVEGQLLDAGKYNLWAIPGRTEWTFIFSNKSDAWHTEYPKGQDALRVKVNSIQGSHMETLAYYFPLVEGKEATLHFHWGETIVPLRIEQVK